MANDWFTQYAQNMIHPFNGPYTTLPSTAPGNPGNLLQSMGNSGFNNPAQILPQTQQPNSGAPGYLQQLFQQLLANSQSTYKQPSAQEILAQATKTAGSQYDPQISAINRQMGRAKTTAGKNKKEIGKLYASGADAYNQDMATGKKTGAAAVADEKARQNDLQKKLSSDYSSSIDSQIAEFKNLGIQDALPDATKNQRGDLDYLSKMNATEGASQLSGLNSQNTADQQYYNEGKGIMRLTGNEAQTSLMTQLTDYLNSQGDARSSLEGQRQAAIAQLQQQLTSQAATQAQQAQGNNWDNMFKLAGLYQQINPQAKQSPATSGLNAASQYLAGATTPQKAQDTMSALNLLLGSGFNPTNQKDANGKLIYPNSPEQSASVGVNYAKDHGWAPNDITGLMQAILAYYGRMGG